MATDRSYPRSKSRVYTLPPTLPGFSWFMSFLLPCAYLRLYCLFSSLHPAWGDPCVSGGRSHILQCLLTGPGVRAINPLKGFYKFSEPVIVHCSSPSPHLCSPVRLLLIFVPQSGYRLWRVVAGYPNYHLPFLALTQGQI